MITETDIRTALTFINEAKRLLSPAYEEREDVQRAMFDLDQSYMAVEIILDNVLKEGGER